jgi:two-component system, LuxR family, sensor kinase FixL
MKESFVHDRLYFLESILHGVVITDLRGHITYWNKSCETIFGYSDKEIIGKPIRLLYDDDNRMTFKEVITQSLENGIVAGRWHGRHKDGSRLWVEVRARIVHDEDENREYCVLSVCDIEKLKTAESDLKENRALAEAVLDASVDAIITINERGEIRSFNRAASKMFGYDEEEVIGKNVKILMPFPYNENHDSYISNYLRTGEKKIIGKGKEVQGLKKEGTVFPIELAVSEVTWEENLIFAAIIKDLSVRRDLEKQILQTGNEERRRIGRDLHDGLGQMLTGIRLISENLARKLKANGVPGADEVQEISDMIKEADEFTRTLSRDMVQVDLENNGLSIALQNLCDRVGKMTGIACKYIESGNIEIDNHTMALHLYRIVQEGLNNVIKHSDAKNVQVRISKNDQHISLIIEDDGRGFDMNKDRFQGSGIQIMKYRAGIMGGILEIVRTEEDLTRIRCIVPNNLEQF